MASKPLNATDEFQNSRGQLATVGGRTYWLDIDGTAANDLTHRSQLAILVEPVTRSTL